MGLDFHRDNLSGQRTGTFLRLFLFPGKVVQWLIYMFPSDNYTKIRAETRHARSPFFTLLYACGAWISLVYLLVHMITK